MQKSHCKNIKLTIDSIGINGEGIAHVDGQTYFVPYVLPGEVVDAEILYYKQGLAFCKVTEIEVQAQNRIAPVCKVFGSCGGCAYQHIPYEDELKCKWENLKQTLSKIAGYTGDIQSVVPSEPDYHYRNKLQLPFGFQNGKVVLGFYKEGTHNVVPTNTCALHGDWADLLIALTLDVMNKHHVTVYDENTGKGLLRHLAVRNICGNFCVTLVANGTKIPNLSEYYDSLVKSFGSNVSLYLNVNKENTNVIFGDKLIKLFGQDIGVDVMGIKLKINPLSFFQVNDNVRSKIYSAIIQKIQDNGGSLVVDAYSGVGLLGAILAKNGADVHNIEIIPEAIQNANELYAANGLHAENICGDSALVLPALLLKLRTNSTKNMAVVLDPPRKGCSESVLRALIDTSKVVKNFTLIYLSCNPATLARDLKIIQEAFYVDKVTPYDMFSHCKGLETLVFLSQK